jgi:hypothetical protein
MIISDFYHTKGEKSNLRIRNTDGNRMSGSLPGRRRPTIWRLKARKFPETNGAGRATEVPRPGVESVRRRGRSDVGPSFAHQGIPPGA